MTFALRLLCGCLALLPLVAAEDSPPSIPTAIAALRHIDPARFQEKAAEKAIVEKISRAWEQLGKGGAGSVAAIKGELATIAKAGEADPWFQLSAGALLWELGKAAEAPAIAAVWRTTPLDFHYDYVFYPAFQAALTRDPAVLPMLAATLAEHKGSVFLTRHSMQLKWPMTHTFIWGVYGREGLPALRNLAASATAGAEVHLSAAYQLALVQDTAALPVLRDLARKGSPEARSVACRLLGGFGHPDDFPLLVDSLAEPDEELAWAAAYGLYEYGDLRAVPRLAALLQSSTSARVRAEAAAGLSHLPTPEGVLALLAWKPADPAERKGIDRFLATMGADEGFPRLKPSEQRERCAKLIAKAGAETALRPDDRRLSHPELLKAAEEWTARRRLGGGDYAWVYDRQVLAAAGPEDLDLLREVRSAVLCRLSDEGWEDAMILDRIIRTLGRRRFRTEPGICDQVVAPGAARKQAP